MFAVEVRDHIMIAHSFRGQLFGPAQALHGATFVIDAAFMSEKLDANGVVVDIGRAHEALNGVLAPLNYRNLDEVPEFKGANLRALAAGKIVLLPWRHAPSRVWRRVAEGAGHRWVDGYLHWHNLADASFADNLGLILKQIDTDAVWLTIDKDVLPESEAFTNWDQGQMPLRAILDLIAGIGASKRIVGADICGEFSAPALRGMFKRIESRFDRPQRRADPARLARNEAVNRELLGTIVRGVA